MDQKSKARMAAILLATGYRRFGDAVDPLITRIADWGAEKGVVGVLEEEGKVILFAEEDKGEFDVEGAAVYVGMQKDNVVFTQSKKTVPVVFGFDYLHKILVVYNLDKTLESMYRAYMG